MTLRQQILGERVASVEKQLATSPDKAFLRLVHSLSTGESMHSFDPADLVDGGMDKQIDTISITESDGEATVCILQAKYTGLCAGT